MTTYKNVVRTTEGNYRLWDKDFVDSIDLSFGGTSYVRSILKDAQKERLWDYNDCILTDAQYNLLHEHYALPGRF